MHQSGENAKSKWSLFRRNDATWKLMFRLYFSNRTFFSFSFANINVLELSWYIPTLIKISFGKCDFWVKVHRDPPDHQRECPITWPLKCLSISKRTDNEHIKSLKWAITDNNQRRRFKWARYPIMSEWGGLSKQKSQECANEEVKVSKRAQNEQWGGSGNGLFSLRLIVSAMFGATFNLVTHVGLFCNFLEHWKMVVFKLIV